MAPLLFSRITEAGWWISIHINFCSFASIIDKKMTTESSPIETDNDSIECFQNYTASEVFIQGLAGLVDQQDVESMIRAQKQILQRFEKTNEMLSNCNTLSVSRLKVAGQQFKNYKQLLLDIQKDLDYTFKKICVLKSKLQSQYPESISASSKITSFEEESGESSKIHSSEQSSTSQAIEHESNQNEPTESGKTLLEHLSKKVEISDSNSSESGEADSHTESNSASNSDTA